MDIITKDNLVGAKLLPLHDFHALSKENQVSLVRIFLSQVPKVKSADLAAGGRKLILNHGLPQAYQTAAGAIH